MTGDRSRVAVDSLGDPEQLRGRVPVREVERTLPGEAFEGLQKQYSSIDGVVQVGLTDDNGRVLLQGSTESGDWAPPGGSVLPGEDWVAAARRAMETQTGAEIAIDAVELYEQLRFAHASDPERAFTAPGVSFSASVTDAPAAFFENPTIVEHPQLPDDHDRTFAWFEAVPDNANENHVEHIELFLE